VTQSQLFISLLGNFSLTYRGETVPNFGGDRPISLLAYLLLHRHTAVSRQQLAFTLWPDSTDKQARTNLRNLLHTVRQTLPEADTYIKADFSTLQWQPNASYSLDVASLTAALAAAKEAVDEEEKQHCLETAVSLYHGDLLPGNYDDWIMPLREELRQTYLGALQQLIALLQARQAYRDAARYSQQLVQQDPLDERAYVQLMRLYALCGDRAGVRRTYEQCADLLHRELDVEPHPTTQAAYEQLLRPESPAAAPPAATSPTRPSLLPTPSTPFIGRETELAQIAQLLADPACRLLTIVGPGGMGKTRLALKTAVGHKPVFANGVAFIDLAPVASASLIAAAIAARLSINLSDLADHQTQLAAHLQDKEMLLVLDNMEHLLAGAALLSDLLAAAPGLKLLVTSRQRLELLEEWAFDLQGFPLPDNASPLADNGGVALFVQAAQRANHQFVLTAADETAVIRICQLVSGMPLGLQLAASWVRVLSCAEIVQEIERDFDFLSTSQRHLPERQRSLRTVFDYSWHLLSAAEREACGRLALFRGGFTREAAEVVAGATLPVLSGLVDKALVNWVGHGRYDMHELVCQYASERLHTQSDALITTQKAHAAYFLELAMESYNELQDEDSLRWFRAIDQEVDNFRAALNWTLQADKLELGLRLGSALRLYWWWRGYLREGLAWLETLLTRANQTGQIHTVPTEVLAAVYMEAGLLAGNLGELQSARAFLEQSLALYRQKEDQVGIARALNNLGFVTSTVGHFAEAEAYSRESLVIHHTVGYSNGMISAYLNLGTACFYQGHVPQSLEVLDEGLTLSRRHGHLLGTALLLGVKANGLRCLQQFEQAQAALLEAETLLREMSNRQGLAANLYYQAWLALDMRQTAEAAARFQESLRLHHQVHNNLGSASVFDGLAVLAWQVERPLPAIQLIAAADAVRQKIGSVPPLLHQQVLERVEQELQTAVGHTAFNAAWQSGQQLPFGEATAVALDLAAELGTVTGKNTASVAGLSD